MSSTIKLYEHNQKAYDALLDMLGERDRACVIKPTGTGKFVIIAKMVQDNPDKRFLLLGTNDYMFNDQMANLTEIAPGFTPENLQFMTYSAAMMAARRGEEISGYDVVVADEFHHCGAEEWGKGVTHILDANESAKVVGLSATPIRYSDGGRNMADEMFEVCAIYVVILLSGLLVFWSAIFIDSKGRKFSRQEDSRILRKHHREIGKTMAINRVTIMGNLTRDAELRKKGDATSVLTFGLAINEKKKDSETGEYVDAPVFVDCALFGARAEALAPYLTKGKKVSVDGRLRYHSWMKNEEKRHALSVLVTDIEFADSKGAGKDTVSAQGQSTEPETYDADIPF